MNNHNGLVAIAEQQDRVLWLGRDTSWRVKVSVDGIERPVIMYDQRLGYAVGYDSPAQIDPETGDVRRVLYVGRVDVEVTKGD